MSQAVFDAVKAGDLDRLRELLAQDPDLVRARIPEHKSSAEQKSATPLHVAIHGGNVEAARLLIEAGADLEARNAYGRTALHDAIEYGLRDGEVLLLEAGAEVDICVAAITGRLERVRELLDGDSELVNDHSTNLSPLGWASFGNQVAIARELIARGARMDDGELLCAASVGHVEVGRVLLEHGADPNAIHETAGITALHAAAGMRYTTDSSGFVSLLLERGADPGIRSRKGKSALEIAEEFAQRQETEADAREGRASRRAGTKNFRGVAEILKKAPGGSP